MLKKGLLSFALITVISVSCCCATLDQVRIKETKDKLRLVLVTSGAVKYKTEKDNSFIKFTLPNTKIKPKVPKTIGSKIMKNISIQSKGTNTEVTVNYKYLTSSKTFTLVKPNRIVVDFSKLSRMLLPTGSVAASSENQGMPEIEKISTKSTPENFKIIINLSSITPYKIMTSESGIILELPNTNSIIKSQKFITKDKLISKVGVDQIKNSVIISISQAYPSFYQIYKTENPTGIVLEFDKASKSTLSTKEIIPGLNHLKIIKGTSEGPCTVNALIINQMSLEVIPYIAVKTEEPSNMFDSVGKLFTFWIPREETKFYKDKVSNIAWEASALGGINGTYFGYQGEPLGVFMINGELISYSIYDRTALIIDKNNQCYIDNVTLSGDISIEGVGIQVTGINNKRQIGEVVVYTPRYGSQTEEDSPGTILSIVDGVVKNLTRSKAWIPKDGFVISIDPSYYESLEGKVKIGSRVDLTLKLSPLSGISSMEVKHVVGGGPRLLKAGNVYISKNSEHFRNDVAQSRAARTAVGITKEGRLAFVTVDKCKQTSISNKSVGMTLEELASVMKEIGCVDAMNLDGGGSSTMVLNSEILNCPANGKEIPVSNAILIKQ